MPTTPPQLPPPLPREWVEDPPSIITSAEEEQEILSRTPQDAASIETDLLGLSPCLGASTSSGDSLGDKDMVASGLKSLDAELARTPRQEMAAFLAVKRERPELVNDDHRASFLWREDFDVKLASQRLVRYWERRRELFGPEKFSLPLTPKGALRDDASNLRQCYVSFLPVKDEYGRSIIFSNQGLVDWTKYSEESMLRMFWYLLELTLDDSDTKRNGVVLVAYTKNSRFQNFNYRYFLQASKLERCYLPLRFRSIHVCCLRPTLHLVLPVVKFALGKRLRERLVLHFGTEENCLSILAQYGLPPDRIPSDMGGCLPSVNVINGELHTRSVALDSSISSGNCSSEPLAVMSEVTKSIEGVESERSLARMQRHPKGIDKDYTIQNLETAMSSKPVCKKQITRRRRALTRSRRGRKGDPRMNKAVAAKLANPRLSAFDALKIGGFKFLDKSISGLPSADALDSEDISLRQRKNQLSRRVRMEKSNQEPVAVSIAMPNVPIGGLDIIAADRGKRHKEKNTSFCSFEANEHTIRKSQGNIRSGTHSSCNVSSALEIKKGEVRGAGVASNGDWNSASGKDPAVDDVNKPLETTDLPLDKSSTCGPKKVGHQPKDDFFETISQLPGLADLPTTAQEPLIWP